MKSLGSLVACVIIVAVLVGISMSILDQRALAVTYPASLELCGRIASLVLAVAGVVGLVGSIVTPSSATGVKEKAIEAIPGSVCILAAATLTGVGGWGTPLALGGVIGIWLYVNARFPSAP